MIVVQIIPQSSISDNIRLSAGVLKDEGLNPQYGWNGNHRLDTFTDAFIFDMLYVSDSKNPKVSGMLNYLYYPDSEKDPISALYNLVENKTDIIELVSYSRYWHGMQIILRPLLIFTDYNGIRFINCIFMGTILLVLCLLMWRKISPYLTICFLLTFSIMNFYILPMCIQYCPCIYIAMIGMILLLLLPNLSKRLVYIGMYFFSIGSMCCFFDFLTTPQLTYGLPFIVCCFIASPKKPMQFMIYTGLLWFIGYSLTFISKWTIATLLTDYNCFALAIEAFNHRISTSEPLWGVEYDFEYALKSLYYVTLANFKWVFLILTLFYIYVYIRHKTVLLQCLRNYYWLLMLAFIVPIWYIVIRNHSFMHFDLFTWRALFLSIYSILLFTCYILSNIRNYRI